MPEELLRSPLGHDAPGASPRRWSMVPVSAAAHAVAVAAVLIIPLAAEVELPNPAPLRPGMQYVEARDLPRMPAFAHPKTSVVRREAAPTAAPPSIRPESEEPRVSDPSPGPVIPDPFGGAGSGAGDPAGPLPTVTVPDPLPPPPPPVARSQPFRVGQGVREPRKLVHVAPVYPTVAQQARVQGTVVLEAVIDERGRVTNIRVLQSSPLLDNAAIDAVRAWRYTPTLVSGVPVPVLMTITVRFTLER